MVDSTKLHSTEKLYKQGQTIELEIMETGTRRPLAYAALHLQEDITYEEALSKTTDLLNAFLNRNEFKCEVVALSLRYVDSSGANRIPAYASQMLRNSLSMFYDSLVAGTLHSGLSFTRAEVITHVTINYLRLSLHTVDSIGREEFAQVRRCPLAGNIGHAFSDIVREHSRQRIRRRAGYVVTATLESPSRELRDDELAVLCYMLNHHFSQQGFLQSQRIDERSLQASITFS